MIILILISIQKMFPDYQVVFKMTIAPNELNTSNIAIKRALVTLFSHLDTSAFFTRTNAPNYSWERLR